MHITSLHVISVLEIDGNFDFDPRVNLLIGPNGCGKTSILRTIEAYYSRAVELGGRLDYDNMMEYFNEHPGSSEVILSASDDWPDATVNSSYSVFWDRVPLLYIPANRVNLPPMDTYVPSRIEKTEDAQVDSPLKSLFDTHSGVFNGYYVGRVIDSVLQGLDPGLHLPDEIREQNQRREREGFMLPPPMIPRELGKILEVGYSCAKSICSEVLRGTAPQDYLEHADMVVHRAMGISVSDHILDEPVYLGGLSAGTQGTLLWIYALALRVASHYLWDEDGQDWRKKPAILLIDEIENHLHPTWQRRVIPALLEHFPGLQIFATTHSPFVLAGLRAGQVQLLERTKADEPFVHATTNTEDIIGWTADEILRTYMGVDDPTDQLTVNRANRLRQLREKEELTPAEQSEMDQLRRQINEDLLSKRGPLEAERESYADLMQRFLVSRQPDLSQDGA